MSTIPRPADLDSHPHFRRAPKKGKVHRWWCSLCNRPEQANVAHFDARGAARHELSEKHQERVRQLPAKKPAISSPSAAVAGPSTILVVQSQSYAEWYERPPADLNAWAYSAEPVAVSSTVALKKSRTPFEDLKMVELRQAINRNDPTMRTFRIRSWMKYSALAEGGHWVDTLEDVEPPPPEIWWSTERADWERELAKGNGASGFDAVSNAQQCDFLSQDNVSMCSDVASFIAYVAEEYEMTHAKKLRGNAFYLLPTERKVAEIQELIYELYDIMFPRAARDVRNLPPVPLTESFTDSRTTVAAPKRDWANIVIGKRVVRTQQPAPGLSQPGMAVGFQTVLSQPTTRVMSEPVTAEQRPSRHGQGKRRGRMTATGRVPTDRPIQVMW
ncbi:hypothetical protein BKA62DRAFT_683484 [Auriculariales sp. MPI-PUGE-AT-0066]|nr:hypothetical protein BKA62DRAFT_683484 [Auriculariales sp. MPI-PUGE-AT-0066]